MLQFSFKWDDLNVFDHHSMVAGIRWAGVSTSEDVSKSLDGRKKQWCKKQITFSK